MKEYAHIVAVEDKKLLTLKNEGKHNLPFGLRKIGESLEKTCSKIGFENNYILQPTKFLCQEEKEADLFKIFKEKIKHSYILVKLSEKEIMQGPKNAEWIDIIQLASLYQMKKIELPCWEAIKPYFKFDI